MTWRGGGWIVLSFDFWNILLDCWLQPRLDLTRLCSIYFVFFYFFLHSTLIFLFFDFRIFMRIEGTKFTNGLNDFLISVGRLCLFVFSLTLFFLYDSIWFLRNHEVWTLTFMPPSPHPIFFSLSMFRMTSFLIELMQHSRTSPSICLSLPYLSTYLSFIFCLFWFDCLVRICDFRAHTISPPPSPCLFFVFIDFWFSTFDFLNHIYNIYWYVFFFICLEQLFVSAIIQYDIQLRLWYIHLRLVFVLGEVRWDELDWYERDEMRVRWIV